MKEKQQTMSPHDLVILLKIVALGKPAWQQVQLADSLGISQSEVSKSLARSTYAGLLNPNGKTVLPLGLLEFIQYGLRYVFPQHLGPVVRGLPTAHSAAPLKEQIQSDEDYVWPYGKGTVRGHSIIPLHASVPEAALKDSKLYELLALVDTMRIGRARERELAMEELKKRIIPEQDYYETY